MKKYIRIISIVINISVVVAAIGTIGYFWGYKQLEVNLLQKGFNLAVGQIVQAVQQTGSVQLDKDLILIKKANVMPESK